MPWRQWDKFDLLQKELLNLNGTVVTIGKDKNYKPVAGTFCLINKLSLAELFWVMKQFDVFVTADSGPMHIAFALDIPTVALFGPVRPSLRVPPERNAKITIIYKSSLISEKVTQATQRKQLDNSAMQQITVEQAFEAVKALWASK
jgi:ADP-heptose:LPS heptosyltransferase